MKKIVNKEMVKYINEVNPSMLAASITFYLLFIIIPVISLLSNILNLLNLDIPILSEYQVTKEQNVVSVIILAISIIWVASRFINALTVTSDVIYQDVKKRSALSRRILSVLLMMGLIVLMIIQIIVVLFFLNFFKNILQISEYYILFIIQFVLQFLSITFILSIVYKYIIPIKIKIRKTFYISLITTLIWYVLTFMFYFINYTLKLNNYDTLYGSMASLMLFIFWLYLIILALVYVIALNYYITKKRQVIK